MDHLGRINISIPSNFLRVSSKNDLFYTSVILLVDEKIVAVSDLFLRSHVIIILIIMRNVCFIMVVQLQSWND